MTSEEQPGNFTVVIRCGVCRDRHPATRPKKLGEVYVVTDEEADRRAFATVAAAAGIEVGKARPTRISVTTRLGDREMTARDMYEVMPNRGAFTTLKQDADALEVRCRGCHLDHHVGAKILRRAALRWRPVETLYSRPGQGVRPQ